MHLLPYDYFTDTPSQTRGLARTASLIRAARAAAQAEGATCLLVDNGDFLTGTPMDDAFAQDMQADGVNGIGPHPMISVMNRLGYDAATLGNHDFDHGTSYLDRILGQAAFPFVLANLYRAQSDEPFLPPHVILTRELQDQTGTLRPIRIGITGLLPPQSIRPRRTLKTVPRTRDMIAAAEEVVPALRSQGADIVLMLAHTGIGEADHHPGLENALRPLSRIQGIDAIVGGHSHQIFPGPLGIPEAPDLAPETGHINGVPLVVPGFWGSHLGVIDLGLTFDKGRWTVTENEVGVRAISKRDNAGKVQAAVPEDPTITNALAGEHKRTLHYVRTPVGHSARRLHSYFSLIAPSAAVQLVQRAQKDFAARVLADTPHADLPILSSASALKCGGIGGPDHFTDVAAGELTLRAIADLYLYPNDLVVLKATGAMIRAWLERSASVFNQLSPDRPDQPVIDPSTPCYLYESVLGLEYQIDLTRAPLYTPRGAPLAGSATPGRVQDLSFAGTPLRDQAEFLLVTNGFRASGGGAYPGLAEAEQVLGAGDCIRDILRDHVREAPVEDLPPTPHWRLVAAPGVTATLECSPRAQSLVDEFNRGADGLTLTSLSGLTNGFHQFRLNF